MTIGALNVSPESIVMEVFPRNTPFAISRTGSQKVVYKDTEITHYVDKYYKAIVMAFQKVHLTKASLQFKDIYEQVCLNLGAPPERAALGFATCPYKGIEKNMMGLIRSWVEERSPHSRQYYFRAGTRKVWRQNERPLLFTNTVLGAKNNACDWRPYSHVRGGGWTFDPVAAAAAEQPSVLTLETAAALYKRKGMQGRARIASAAIVPIMRTTYTVTGGGSVTAIY